MSEEAFLYKVALVVVDPPDLADTIFCVPSVTRASIAGIKRRIQQGEPVYEHLLFENDHEQSPAGPGEHPSQE